MGIIGIGIELNHNVHGGLEGNMDQFFRVHPVMAQPKDIQADIPK